MTKRPATQIDDGEWVTVAWRGQHEQCCTCGSRHVVDYRVVADEYLPGRPLKFKGLLQFRARRLGSKQ